MSDETDPDAAESSGVDQALATFLADADDVYDEYDKGYVDADAALSVLSGAIADLRSAAEEGDAAEGNGDP